MKKILSAIAAAVLLVCLACGGIAGAENEWFDEEERVTGEWIREVYGFSNEDLEGIAVEEVAEALWWTRDEVLREFGKDAPGLLRTLKWGQKQLELHRTERRYQESAYDVLICKRTQGKLKGFDNLKRIDFRAEFSDDGFFCKISGMLDLENRKICFSESDWLDVCQVIGTDIPTAKYIEIYDMTDEETEAIVSSLKADWFRKPFEINGGVWSAGFAFADGSVCSFSLDDIGADPEMMALIRLFFAKMKSEGGSKAFFLSGQ